MASSRAGHMAELHVRFRGVLIWLGAAAIIAAFAWADGAFGCGVFQRGGAALVIYAILVSILSLRARGEYGDELNAIQLEQCQIAQAMYAEDHAPREEDRLKLRRKIEPRLKDLDRRLERLIAAGQRFQDLRVIEGPILILGTLIWGFGDLILRAPVCVLG